MAGKSALAEFVCDANEALALRLVRKSDEDEEDAEDPWAFNPEMTHQVFGEQEEIFGYRNLAIECLFCAGSLKAFIKHECDEELPNQDEVKPDPIAPTILKILAEDQVAPNEDAFYAAVDKDDEFRPMGEKLTEWTTSADGETRTFEVYHNTNQTKGFREYLSRAQPFIMFFIDAASYIDIDDDRWQIFLLFEK